MKNPYTYFSPTGMNEKSIRSSVVFFKQMKKITQLAFAVFALFASVSLSAQVVPNGDFETWEDNGYGGMQPTGWMAIFNSAAYSNVHEVAGYGGGSAAQLLATDYPGVGVMAPSLISEGFSVAQNYARMHGYVKGAPAGGDTLYILTAMYADASIVGAGVAYITQQIDEFTAFEVNIIYNSKADADSCIISFIAGQFSDENMATEGTSFTVDEISLSGIAGTADLSPVFNEIGQPYPNPVQDHINLPFDLVQPDEIAVTLFDVTGKIVFNQQAKMFSPGYHELKFDISDLTTGTYIISILPSDGSTATRKFVVK